MSIQLWVEEMESPVGRLMLVSNGRALCALEFEGCLERMQRLMETHLGPVELKAAAGASDFRRRMEAYFAGEVTVLDKLAVETGGTAFQRSVWSALRTIGAGTTLSYQQLAARIGRPSAARAVGMANSQNPVAIVQPCHRVIGANGKLTGYAAGLDRKRWLLAHEGVMLF